MNRPAPFGPRSLRRIAALFGRQRGIQVGAGSGDVHPVPNIARELAKLEVLATSRSA